MLGARWDERFKWDIRIAKYLVSGLSYRLAWREPQIRFDPDTKFNHSVPLSEADIQYTAEKNTYILGPLDGDIFIITIAVRVKVASWPTIDIYNIFKDVRLLILAAQGRLEGRIYSWRWLNVWRYRIVTQDSNSVYRNWWSAPLPLRIVPLWYDELRNNRGIDERNNLRRQSIHRHTAIMLPFCQFQSSSSGLAWNNTAVAERWVGKDTAKAIGGFGCGSGDDAVSVVKMHLNSKLSARRRLVNVTKIDWDYLLLFGSVHMSWSGSEYGPIFFTASSGELLLLCLYFIKTICTGSLVPDKSSMTSSVGSKVVIELRNQLPNEDSMVTWYKNGHILSFREEKSRMWRVRDVSYIYIYASCSEMSQHEKDWERWSLDRVFVSKLQEFRSLPSMNAQFSAQQWQATCYRFNNERRRRHLYGFLWRGRGQICSGNHPEREKWVSYILEWSKGGVDEVYTLVCLWFCAGCCSFSFPGLYASLNIAGLWARTWWPRIVICEYNLMNKHSCEFMCAAITRTSNG